MSRGHPQPPSEQPRERRLENFSHGEGLTPLQGMEVAEVGDFDELLARMARTSFQGRNLGRAAEVLELMFTEPGNFNVLTISGALTVAQQGPILVELVYSGLVQAVVGTGALITHDVLENMGFHHYEAPPQSDAASHLKGICRVYDSAELETQFNAFEHLVEEHFEELLPAAVQGGPGDGSAAFCARLGQLLLRRYPAYRTILSAAAERGVPVYIPAFTDSEMALGLFKVQVTRQKDMDPDDILKGASPIPFNVFEDVLDFTRRVERHRQGNLGIFTLGGGVPRNWAQQVGPALDILALEGTNVHTPRFARGVRICPDPPNWGHLSGCTYEEGVSWAKFVPIADGGRYAEVLADATLVLPLLVKGVLQRMEKKGWQRPARPASRPAG